MYNFIGMESSKKSSCLQLVCFSGFRYPSAKSTYLQKREEGKVSWYHMLLHE